MAEHVTLTPKQWLLAAGGGVLLVLLGVYLGSGRGGTTVVTPPPSLPQVVGQLNPQQQAIVDLRSRAAMEFVFFHELGHMMISELKLPAIGPEEDVADEFATFALTDVLKAAPDEQKDLYSEIVYSGALFWRISGAIREAQNNGAGATGGISWYDEHAPDMRRYYNILCIAVGADPLRFAGKAALDGVPQQRLSRCGEEYKTKHAAWDTLMAPHVAGTWHKMFASRHLTLQVGPVGKKEWQPFEASYTQGGYFQQMLDGIDSTVTLPETIPVIAKSCDGVSNAWWSPSDKRITLCHEFFQDVTNTFAVAVLAESRQGQNGAPDQQPPQQGPPQQQPPQAPPPQQAPPQQQPQPQPGGNGVPPDTYQDPQGRYSVRIPPGWQGRATSPDSIAISHGNAFVNLIIGHDNSSPQQVVTAFLQQIAPQWSQVKPGPAQAITFGGRPGFYHMLSGLNPKGVPGRLYVSAAPLDQGGSLAMITSVAEAEFEASKEALGLIQLSVRIGGGATQAAPVPVSVQNRAAPAGSTAGLGWIAPGLRITYYAAAARIDGSHNEMVLDEKGEWKYVDTGEAAAEVHKDDRASGEGYSQINVVDITGDTAAVEIRNFGIVPNMVTLPQYDGWVGSLSKGNDYWMNPAELRNMKEQHTQGLNVTRRSCTINGHNYNAIRIHTQTGNGSTQKTYDLDTGVLLLVGISSSGGNYQQRDPTNMVHTTSGATSLGMMRLVSIRQVNLPWSGMPAPAWVAQTPSLVYAGNYSVTVPGGPPQQLGFSSRVTVTHAGARWAQFTEEDTVQGPMMVPTQPTVVQRVAGSTQVSGLWIPPDVLARLAPGQIDADPVTGYRVTFDGLRGNVAQFTEGSGQVRQQLMYDRASGRLIGYTQAMPIGPALLQVQASLR